MHGAVKKTCVLLHCCLLAACAEVDDKRADVRPDIPGEVGGDPSVEGDSSEAPPDPEADQPADDGPDQTDPDGIDLPGDPAAEDLRSDDVAVDDAAPDTTCGGVPCGAGETCCFDIYCAALGGSTEDCGSCGNTCWPGEADICSSGSCVCSGSSRLCAGLPADYCCEGDGCVNTNTNPDHCGFCGYYCFSDETCIDGWCESD